MAEAKTPEGRRKQAAARQDFRALKRSANGDVYVMSCGTRVTATSAFNLAKGSGVAISHTAISKRLRRGVRDINELLKAPSKRYADGGVKARNTVVAKQSADAEFQAALASVNSRKTRGFK